MPLWSISACEQAGVPLLYVGNFTWTELYREFLPEHIWKAYAAEYRKIRHGMLYTLHNPEMLELLSQAELSETSLVARPFPPGRNSGDSRTAYLPGRVRGFGNVGTVHTACLGRRCGGSFLRHRGRSADGKQCDGDSLFYAAHAGLCGGGRLCNHQGWLGHGGRMPAGAKANGSVCA